MSEAGGIPTQGIPRLKTSRLKVSYYRDFETLEAP